MGKNLCRNPRGVTWPPLPLPGGADGGEGGKGRTPVRDCESAKVATLKCGGTPTMPEENRGPWSKKFENRCSRELPQTSRRPPATWRNCLRQTRWSVSMEQHSRQKRHSSWRLSVRMSFVSSFTWSSAILNNAVQSTNQSRVFIGRIAPSPTAGILSYSGDNFDV